MGIEVNEVGCPAVVTVDLRLNEPRYISLPGILRARKKSIERLEAASLVRDLAPRAMVLRLEATPKRKAGVRLKDVDELANHIRDLIGPA